MEGRASHEGGPSQVIEQYERAYWLDNTYIRIDLRTSVKRPRLFPLCVCIIHIPV